MMTTSLRLTLGGLAALLLAPAASAAQDEIDAAGRVTLGPRPLFLVQDMDEGSQRERELKAELLRCAASERRWRRSDFSIGHRGAALQFPEHTREAYLAGAQMGAGILECDVTFTADRELVCRHSQYDLHTTTNILATDLAQKCSVPPAFNAAGELTNAAEIQCCTSDITLAEYRTLQGKMDGADTEATSIEEYLAGTPGWRTDLYAARGTLMTHAESIELFKALGVKMTPELKAASVAMPFHGMSQEDYAQKLIDEYKAADVPASDVYAQSFNLDDVRYWIDNEPEFGEQAVYLDDRYDRDDFDHTDPATWSPTMEELAEAGVPILAPPDVDAARRQPRGRRGREPHRALGLCRTGESGRARAHRLDLRALRPAQRRRRVVPPDHRHGDRQRRRQAAHPRRAGP